MIWITREKPKIDRIACLRLIRRFIDPDAQIVFMPASEVLTRAAELVGDWSGFGGRFAPLAVQNYPNPG